MTFLLKNPYEQHRTRQKATVSNDFRFPLQKIRKFAIDFTPSEKTAFVASIQLSYYFIFYAFFLTLPHDLCSQN